MPFQYPILAGLMIQRIWELAVSRRRLAAAEEAGAAERIREPFYPAMVLVHAGWFAGCWSEVLLIRPQYYAWIVIPMLAVWAVSLSLRLWMLSALGELWNVRLVSREEQPVISTGPYRFVRHPNYLSVILEITAVPLLLGAYWTALAATIANAAVIGLRIRNEEAYLFAFEEYRDMFADKKRLIPGLF